MNIPKLFIPVTILTYLSINYVDRPVSLFIQKSLYSNRQWSRLTVALPDMLLIIVVSVSLSAYFSYIYRRKKLLLDAHTRFLSFIALSLPVSYLFKTVLKYIFGRVETRVWLQNPQLYGFHWFQNCSNYSGFPSGHMIVFTTLFAAIGRYHAEYKVLCYSLLSVLAVLLVATNYHFVGDLLFGAYTGFLTEYCLNKVYPEIGTVAARKAT
jgi:hypothetical protein